MKRLPYLTIMIISCLSWSCAKKVHTMQELSLRYNTPAKVWEETLPLGNGRIGMMPDGGVNRELIVLNDITMWSGSEDAEAVNPIASSYLSEIQRLLLNGDNLEAQELMYQYFRCGGQGSAFGMGKDAPYGCFQMLANLNINYQYPTNASVVEYERTLSLNDAIATTNFKKGGVTYSREYFASHADDVLAIRISADKRKSISFEIDLNRAERAKITVQGNTIMMEGQLNDGYNTDKGVRYFTQLEIENKGGKISSNDSTLKIINADEAIIYISTSTDMLDEQYVTTVEDLLEQAKIKSFDKLKNTHIKAYQKKFNRVELNLGEQDNSTPTGLRLLEFSKKDNPAFVALYFQYGRYLMISGTNEMSLPLNLQGMWANTVQTPWNGDYHLNINLQMNYWPTEVCNLSELHEPLLDFTKSIVQSGENTAKNFYNANGWVAHMMTNPWKFTAPGEHASWGATNTGGAWLCQHLWEHYAFTQNREYLKTIYPTLVGAAEFFLSSMIAEPKHGWLVTAPSSSPENSFYLSNNSKSPVYVCMGPTMDVQLVKELFTNVLQTAEILGKNDDIIRKIKETLPKLPPMQISAEGYLQEWLEDYKEVDVHHRHVSHLYGLYPSNQISPKKTPDLAEAAKVTLNRRGDEGTGWSRAWKVNFWARLQDGNRAYKLLKSLLKPTFDENMNLIGGGGTYPNLFCAHPPFQIDGNFGGTSGIAEMLIQSHDGFIEILPAVPDTWTDGNFRGLCVRGGAEVDVVWINGQITEITLHAKVTNSYKIKVPKNAKALLQGKKELQATDGVVTLDMKHGEEVSLGVVY